MSVGTVLIDTFPHISSNLSEAAGRPPPKTYPPLPSSTSTSPYSALATVPETITGPAMVNIFTIVPVISPSA